MFYWILGGTLLLVAFMKFRKKRATVTVESFETELLEVKPLTPPTSPSVSPPTSPMVIISPTTRYYFSHARKLQ